MQQTELHHRFIELLAPLESIPTNTEPSITKLTGIRLIAYDFYGTLFISGVGDIGIDDGNPDSQLLEDAMKGCGITLLQNHASTEGFEVYNQVVSQSIEKLRGMGIENPEPDIRQVWQEVLTEMRRRELIQFKPDAALYSMMSVEFEARMNPVWPMPNVEETLLTFKEKGMTQGIISNSQFYTPVVLEALSGHSLDKLGFESTLLHWSYEEKMKKPGLEFYKRYLEKVTAFDTSIKPEEILYIGNDMLKDIWPAHTLGMKTALFAGDSRSLKWRRDDERCKDLEPDLVITDVSQILSAIA